MSDRTTDFSHSLDSDNQRERGLPGESEEALIKTFQKFGVNYEEVKKEITVLDFIVSPSQEKDKNSVFGEFDSVAYKIVFIMYNVKFTIRLLTFHQDNKYQILKLDIKPETTDLKKELEYCCNSLQRRRNLHLMITTLTTFARFIESRRLICDVILRKNKNIKIEQNKDGGIIIVYEDDARHIKIGVFWSIACNSRHEVSDVVEVYYQIIELPNRKDIINKLTMLTDPYFDFHQKYHLWKSLIDDVSPKILCAVNDKMCNTSSSKSVTLNSDNNRKSQTCASLDLKNSLVIDKMPSTSAITEVEKVIVLSSDCEDHSQSKQTYSESLSVQEVASAVLGDISTIKEPILEESSKTEIKEMNNQASKERTGPLNNSKIKEMEVLEELSLSESSEDQNETSVEIQNALGIQKKSGAVLKELKAIKEKFEDKDKSSSTGTIKNVRVQLAKDKDHKIITIDSSDSENQSKKSYAIMKKFGYRKVTWTRISSICEDQETSEIHSSDSENESNVAEINGKIKKTNSIDISGDSSEGIYIPLEDGVSDEEYLPKEDLIQRKKENLVEITSKKEETRNKKKEKRIESLKKKPSLLDTPPGSSGHINSYKSHLISPSTYPYFRMHQNSLIPGLIPVVRPHIYPNADIVFISDISRNLALFNSIIPSNLINPIAPIIPSAVQMPPSKSTSAIIAHPSRNAPASTTQQIPNNLINPIVPRIPPAVQMPPSKRSSAILARLSRNAPASTTQQSNVHIRVVPDDLVSPKKPKLQDDGLEITSVTYVVPD